MKAALLRYAAGTPTRLPHRLLRQLVAARYGQSPAAVDAWPADDFSDAANSLGVTGIRSIGGGQE
jgi:hypothetical protein